jgi:hypothetical protein
MSGKQTKKTNKHGRILEDGSHHNSHSELNNTGLVKIMLTLMEYVSPADRRKPWGTV